VEYYRSWVVLVALYRLIAAAMYFKIFFQVCMFLELLELLLLL